MDGYPSLSTKIFLVSAVLSIVAALQTPFRQFAISCIFHSGRCNALSILYLVRTLFHCFQYTARILWRSHSSVVSISPFMSAYQIGRASCRESVLIWMMDGSLERE